MSRRYEECLAFVYSQRCGLTIDGGVAYVVAMLFDTGFMTTDIRAAMRLAPELEAMGFDGIWTAEAGHDPYLPCVAVAASTSRVSIGTNIAVAFPRSPLVHAQLAWDLAAASKGRFILGLGTQVKGHNERRYSTPWGSPGPRLREMIQVIRMIWDTWQNGTRPKFHGEFYRFDLMTPFFSPAPHDWPHIPIYIAGVNPYMCGLAGEMCDGFHLHPMHSVRYVREVVFPNIDAGAAKTGRHRADVKIATTAFAIMGHDRDEIARAREAVRMQIAFYASTPAYRVILDVHGWGDIGQQLSAKAAQGDWGGMGPLITDEMLDAFAVEGTYDEVPAKIRAKYTGVLDRVGFYVPAGMPGMGPEVWKGLIDGCRA